MLACCGGRFRRTLAWIETATAIDGDSARLAAQGHAQRQLQGA